MSERVPSESQEQKWLFEWARLRERAVPELRLLFHIPNEGKRTKATGGKMVAEGLKSGVPDLFLPVARGCFHGLFIEMKRVKGGRVSLSQHDWITELVRQGYRCVICRGWEEAKDEIERYLKDDKSGCV